MKKIVLAIVALLLTFVLVLGCGQQAAEPAPAAAEPEPVKTTEPAKTTTTSEPVVTEPEPEPVKQMSDKMVELLGKSNGRVSSMEYMYQDALNKPEEWKTWVKGNLIHIELRELENVRDDVYVDNIYLNTATQTAVGYCEAKVYRCADPNDGIEVNYKKYARKSPRDWLAAIEYAEKDSEETLQQRTAWKVYGTDNKGRDFTMWIDEYYGLPIKVVVAEGSTKNEYIYEDIGFNGVEESDLQHNLVTTSYKA